MSAIERNNYDNVAGFYDWLAGLIFGSVIRESQFSLLHYSFPGSRILIVGGGTGAILEELGRLKAAPLTITFIELSEKMLLRAQKKNAGAHKVSYIRGDIEYFTPDHLFDIIITPFLFDNFTTDKTNKVFNHLNGMLRSGGSWLFTDFHISSETPWWQGLLLKLMYRFFKILARVEANQLPDTASLFARTAYTCKQEHFFYGNFIRAAAYLKSNE